MVKVPDPRAVIDSIACPGYMVCWSVTLGAPGSVTVMGSHWYVSYVKEHTEQHGGHVFMKRVWCGAKL